MKAEVYWAIYKGTALILEVAAEEAERLIEEENKAPSDLSPFEMLSWSIREARKASDDKGDEYDERFFTDAKVVGGMSIRVSLEYFSRLERPASPVTILKCAMLNLEHQAKRVAAQSNSWTLDKVH